MNVIEHTDSRWYAPRKPSVKEAINAKMKVLREFYIVDKDNEDEIRNQLEAAIKAHPDEDYERVLDRVAHTMIERKLDSVL